MPQKSDYTVHILEGRATLFKRPLTPHWHVRYKVYGKWERITTKCEELKEAKSKAEEIVSDARFRERNALPVISKKFKAVATRANTARAVVCAGRDGAARGHNLSQR